MNKQSPIFYAEIKDGKIQFQNKDLFLLYLGSLEGKEVEVQIKKLVNKRTESQNNSLHLYFELLAEAFNEAGLDMRKVIRQDVDIPWSKESVKNYLWRPLQKAQLNKKSTTELDKHEDITLIYETLNRFTSRFGIHIPFPSIDNEKINA